jgi:glycosyltransferase involved in cell wall biosynthesis
MKLSVIVSVLNSHEIVRRQVLHWSKMNLPDDVEIIYLDDGSKPPLLQPDFAPKNFRIHATNDFRPWTVEVARNLGARLATGENLLMTDVDYIIGRDSIEAGRNLTHDKQCFKRQFGVLNEDGVLTQDMSVLKQYGLEEGRARTRGVEMPPHPNNFIMKRDVFFRIGGYREDLVDRPYPNKGDTYFKRTWAEAYAKGEVTLSPDRTVLFMFPNGQFCGDVDFNPFGLFHDLTRKTESNHWYMKDKCSAP